MNTFRQIVFILIIFIIACGRDRTPVNIKGNAKGIDGVVRVSTGDSVLFAENINKNGEFTIEGIVAPGFYNLELFENGKSEKNEFLIYLDSDPVQIRFDVSNLKNYPIISSKSKYQNDISKYYSRLNPLLQGADTDYKNAKKTMEYEIDRTADGDKVIQLIEEFSKVEKRRNSIQADVRENFIVNNPSSLLSAYLIIQSENDIINKPALYNDLYENLSPDIQKSRYGKKAKLLVKRALKRTEGLFLPAIEGEMPNGKPFRPETIKGKITLVMFWASWNNQSIGDLTALKSVYQKLKPLGFEIVAIALDKSPEKWKKFIKDNQLNWMHVSDFKGANSANIENFNNNRIPYYFLVGPDLRISEQDFPVSSIEIYFNDLKNKFKVK